jgi:hypothetical protein
LWFAVVIFCWSNWLWVYGDGFDVGLCCIATVPVGLILGLSTVMVLVGSFGFDGGCGLWDAGDI